MQRSRLAILVVSTSALICSQSPSQAAFFWPGQPQSNQGLPTWLQCRAAIAYAERQYQLPSHLLAAIGRVESGRRGPDGQIAPWPFSINFEGADTIFESKRDAVAGVRKLLATGGRSIDVGCLQVNLMYHPDAFASLEDAFDPWRNADYAARFLLQLYNQTGSWETATANYHSATPGLGGPYAAKVKTALADEVSRRPAGVTEPVSAFAPSSRLAPASPFGRYTASGGAIARPPGGIMPLASLAHSGEPYRFASAPPPGGITAGAGRGLAAYRSAPVRLASTLFRR